ncbi:hypothetical protein Taro_006311 [Colocasia esculenta]|uniref:Uncharacterized protein n=1 Tax=Colocasia esculenta TaxID=4460 RepID=A0A843TUY6_COLES|nr:hypothetical protein [Colocasia esculenta]
MHNIRFWPKLKEGDGGASRDHVATGRMGALSRVSHQGILSWFRSRWCGLARQANRPAWPGYFSVT